MWTTNLLSPSTSPETRYTLATLFFPECHSFSVSALLHMLFSQASHLFASRQTHPPGFSRVVTSSRKPSLTWAPAPCAPLCPSTCSLCVSPLVSPPLSGLWVSLSGLALGFPRGLHVPRASHKCLARSSSSGNTVDLTL